MQTAPAVRAALGEEFGAEIKALYDEFFKEPNSPISHKYLHTHYAEQFIYMPDVEDRV